MNPIERSIRVLFSASAPAAGLCAAAMIITSPVRSETTPMTPADSSSIVFVGTYTGKGSEGIYRFLLNHESGELKPDGLAAKITSPSFLAVSADRKYLYCCNEISNFLGKRSGAATSFEIKSDKGELKQLDQAPSGGVGPCYISLHPDGSGVFVANYGSGDVCHIPTMPGGELEQEPSAVAHHEGSSVVKGRQEDPHAHCVRPDPTGKWALAVDLGTDEVIAYKLAGKTMDTSAPMVNDSRPGAGPRHIAFHPDGKYAYVSNELDSTISAYEWYPDSGRLSEIHHLTTLPADHNTTEPTYPAEVLVHPNGDFVYLSNRGGSDSIAIYKVDKATGRLTIVGHEPTRGEFPRGMALSPKGDILIAANQNTNDLTIFRIDNATGKLTFLSQHKDIVSPAHVLFY